MTWTSLPVASITSTQPLRTYCLVNSLNVLVFLYCLTQHWPQTFSPPSDYVLRLKLMCTCIFLQCCLCPAHQTTLSALMLSSATVIWWPCTKTLVTWTKYLFNHFIWLWLDLIYLSHPVPAHVCFERMSLWIVLTVLVFIWRSTYVSHKHFHHLRF